MGRAVLAGVGGGVGGRRQICCAGPGWLDVMTGRRQDTSKESAVMAQACHDSNLRGGGDRKEGER